MASLDRLPSSFIDTIIIPVKLLRFIGLEVIDDDKARFKNYCKFIVFFLLSFMFCYGEIFFLIKINELDAGILEIANAISCFFLVMQSLFKLSLMRKKHFIRSVVYEIAELWPDTENQEKKELMEYWLHRNKTACACILKFTIVGLLIYNGISLVIYFILRILDKNPAYMFPFELYYPFEIDSLWKYVAVNLMHTLATTMIYECSYLACDMLLFTLTVNVSMLFCLLQYDLLNINVDRRAQEADESLENLKNVVKRHQKILKLAKDLNEIFSVILLNVLIISSLIITFFGFLTIVIKVKFQQIKYLTATLEVLLAVFYIILPGQILSDTSSGVADAAYQSLWYNSDQRFRKIIVIMIARSQKPCKLRALGYADINFETFYKICGKTWSYMSVVNQMYQNSLQ
ncbi:odorant receptor 67a-like [Cydia strobilella]|uniref:odorant receptor 67a-like n=1 Tax=Cydia strobilella TaxID=1100964 RepID=UPI00300709D7